MNKFKNIGLSIVSATILFTGCATTELQTNVRMSQSVFIDPVKKELRTVFVSSKNTSGQPINLENSLVSDLQAKGYRVVDDPDEATYILMVNVLYCDKKQENNAIGAGLATGAIGAGVSGYNNGGAGQAIGVGLGAAVIGGLIGKATEDTIYQMQVDVLIKEKAKNLVLTQNSTVSGQASVKDGQKSGFINSFGGSVRDTNATGHINSNMANDKTQYYEEERKEYKTVMLAEATKMDLTLEEATPILEKQISNQISGLF
ncbi:conjugal transfer protein TraT [Aliarcobacter trophiarum LMG 25534]|uniref:Conjugal transfer protein TraT n=1 Tax=Aliarcobacter trophiarum LMG 25534 TaxID=1032241 RepID=A0AAD0QIL9_9BACT|nr:complement resistance protein TraT [Aliarcobacter trophiarum]AXK48126.1 putative TraT complement resistance protein [Aliarcobacter trophiarum LMG 25534]RXI28393.1 conjugal transfer protein TraT [Aliarcobacter trophiarum]RXJ93198.1 conjugal transfer protein TraT [Aliarcobacter trophiarum LMG 25534]